MKKITVAVAALAAGMTTFAAVAQPRGGDRPMVKAAATKKGGACPYLMGCGAPSDKKAASAGAKALSPRAGEARTAAVAETPAVPAKRKTAALAPKPTAKKKMASPARKPKVDAIKTASVSKSPRPKLAARARLQASMLPGVDDKPLELAPASTKMVAASAAGAVPAVRYGAIVSRYAASYGVPEQLAHAVIRVESNYRPNALGNAGEVGLMQIKPDTARGWATRAPSRASTTPRPISTSASSISPWPISLSGGTTCGTILRYNAGHAATRMNPVSRAYCGKVMRIWPAPADTPFQRRPAFRRAFSFAFRGKSPLYGVPAGRAAAPATAERPRVRKVRAPWKHGAG